MKIICKQEKLVRALNIAAKAISSASTMSITKGFLIKTEGDLKASFSATDFQLTIITNIDAIVNEHGSVVVSSRMFMDLIKKLPGGDILISTDERNVVSIKTESAEYELQGLEESEYPRLDTGEEGKKISLPREVVRTMIEGTCFAASTDESRGIITGTLVEIEKGELNMVALDGYRVAVRREEDNTLKEEEEKIVIPARILRETGKILAETATEEEEDVIVEISEKKAILLLENTIIKMSVLQGDYIKYREVIPKERLVSVKVERQALQGMIERIAMFRSDGKNAFVRLSVKGEELTISSRAEVGKGKETISIEKEGEDIEIGFDSKFILEALKTINDEKILLEFNTSVSPCVISPVSGNKYTYMILPVRLSTVNI